VFLRGDTHVRWLQEHKVRIYFSRQSGAPGYSLFCVA
jgi:hypothetical protein